MSDTTKDAVPGAAILPDGSAFAVLSPPLPADHWIYAERTYSKHDQVEPDDLPAPIFTHAMRAAVVAAVRYAVRGATICGKEPDFDPDALVQNAVYALCGPYGTLEWNTPEAADVAAHSQTDSPVEHVIADKTEPGKLETASEMTDAARDVIAERQRQVSAEGWTPEHDDEHEEGELAAAAGCYAIWGWGGHAFSQAGDEPKPWPWNRTWWKPSTLRRHCVKAAALLLAEIERIDRAAPSTGDQS
ncbi:hypothetical protein NE850_27595 [Paraburkholderia sp. USG1]|uniref:hypothetical protein n=1 Tax=Paraburkholderia sp. USG1 TaxID=2952268 RepID=UPI0028611CBE|nr:hypothetical protein [Paraburkholderia sp. USG1]MDR8400078.1 hypothetical protein [Paraburkholderia sp. USG1]